MSTSRTSCIELISSTHCEQRKREREISKPDLQAALKYGKKVKTGSRNGKKRLKFTYNNIAYITEDDGVTSVTCFAEEQLPLTAACLDDPMRQQITEQRRQVQTGLAPITSHTGSKCEHE
jgi:hypothetical protein